MSKFKLSHLFWAVLAVGALFVAACDTGTDEGSSGPGLLPLASSVSADSLYANTSSAYSSDGMDANGAVTYEVPLANAKTATDAQRDLKLLFAKGVTLNFEVVKVDPPRRLVDPTTGVMSPDDNTAWVGIKMRDLDVPNGVLAKPKNKGFVTVKVTGGGNQRFVRIHFTEKELTPNKPADGETIINGVSVETVKTKDADGKVLSTTKRVTIQPDQSIKLSDLQPGEVTWTVRSHSDPDKAKNANATDHKYPLEKDNLSDSDGTLSADAALDGLALTGSMGSVTSNQNKR